MAFGWLSLQWARPTDQQEAGPRAIAPPALRGESTWEAKAGAAAASCPRACVQAPAFSKTGFAPKAELPPPAQARGLGVALGVSQTAVRIIEGASALPARQRAGLSLSCLQGFNQQSPCTPSPVLAAGHDFLVTRSLCGAKDTDTQRLGTSPRPCDLERTLSPEDCPPPTRCPGQGPGLLKARKGHFPDRSAIP